MEDKLRELMKIQINKMDQIKWITEEIVFLKQTLKLATERAEYLSKRTKQESDLFYDFHEKLQQLLEIYMRDLMNKSDELLESFLKCE